MSANALNDCFEKWNPMKTAYMNPEFNQYISGPGAHLHEELQPAQQAYKQDTNRVPTLVFKNVPKEMTKQALRNMCSKHGNVREVRNSSKSPFYFVDMATVGDMEAALRALENNNYGFTIMVNKERKANALNIEGKFKNENPPTVPPKNTGIDIENRKYRTSTKNHKRPSLKDENPFNVSNATTSMSGLPMNLFTNDAHSLERQGLSKLPNNDRFSYRNGRSMVEIPQKVKQFLDEKQKASSGEYIESEDKYINCYDNKTIPNKIAKCSRCQYACDTVCERCSQYYCSIDCQKKDWPVHRYKCGKPIHLQKTPPAELQVDNNLPSIVETEKPAALVDTSKKETKEISSANSIKPKTIPRQLRFTDKKVTQQNPNPSKPSAQFDSEKLVDTPSQQSSVVSKTSSIDNKVTQHNPTSSKPSPQLDSQKLVVDSVDIPSQQSSVVSKTSSKRLPAALKIVSQQYSNIQTTSDKSISQSSASKSSLAQVSSSSSVSQNNSTSLSQNNLEVYKQNMPRSGNIVTMTAFSKTNLVFVRSITYESHLSYINTVDTLQRLGKNLHPLENLPKSGDVVIFKYEGTFYRALVMSVASPAKIVTHFMDVGNIEQGTLEDLFAAPRELIYKPRHAIPVLLKNVPDVYITDGIRKFMHTYLNNINLVIRYKPEDFHEDTRVHAVELIDETTEQNLNKIIMKLAKPVEPRDTDEICDRDYLARKLISSGQNVELIVMDNSLMVSGCISCTTKAYAVEVEKFKKDIQAYVKSIPERAYTPRIDELCIAQYEEDGLWYRGICLETVGDGHPSIHFFDYGNITMVPIEGIRRYPRQFTYPIYTVDCAIDGLPEFCDDKLVEELEDLIPNGEQIKCENVMVDEESNFCILSMPNVIRRLTELGLI